MSNNSTDLSAFSPEVAMVKVIHHQDLNKTILIALILASSLLGGILLLLCAFWICRMRRLKKYASESNGYLGTLLTHPRTVYHYHSFSVADASRRISLNPVFTYSRMSGKKASIAAIEYQLLASATANFSPENIIGQGGLGCVYKARFPDNFQAAVKKIFDAGKESDKEFENEIEILSRCQHQNIVSLLGYCIRGEERFLMYEMMDYGSLESLLHGPSHGSSLSWHLRLKVALDIARGLEYLHEHCYPPVIHRDLKSSNILLDSSFNAKIADFGLAISGGISKKATDIKLSGTLGYVAPEYLLDGKLTDKSDVYAFGVVLLELLTGKRPVERVDETQCQSIVTWASPHLTDRTKLPNIVDPAIKDTMNLKHLYQVAAIAVLCIQPEPSYRPLITDVLHSFIPLVPTDLGGTLRVTDSMSL